jgi:hypothetical protein
VSNYNKQYTPYTEKSNGFSASLGVIGKVSKELRLGATIETPTWWRMDRVYTEYGLITRDIWDPEHIVKQ